MYHAAAPSGPVVLLLLDLETTGTAVGSCRIVELAAAQAFDHPGLPGACFAAVVRAPDEVLQSQEARAAAAVHGIADDEIKSSHVFPVVWARFLDFLGRLQNDYVEDDNSDSERDHVGPPRVPDAPPAILVAAHNGYTLFMLFA